MNDQKKPQVVSKPDEKKKDKDEKKPFEKAVPKPGTPKK